MSYRTTLLPRTAQSRTGYNYDNTLDSPTPVTVVVAGQGGVGPPCMLRTLLHERDGREGTQGRVVGRWESLAGSER